MRRLLIVDDEDKYREKIADLANGTDLEIILASGAKEGIDKAVREKPDAIITDKDMPDGSGNDLAKEVKQVYDAYIAGTTGGDPDDFDSSVIDMRFSKQDPEEEYINVIRALATDAPYTTQHDTMAMMNTDAFTNYMAIDLLVQGYIASVAMREGMSLTGELDGEEDPSKDEEIKEQMTVPSEEATDGLLDLQKVGIDPQELYEQSQSDTKLKDFYERNKGVIEQLGENKTPGYEDLKAFHEEFTRLSKEYK